MKKTLTLVAIAAMTAFYACGPSAEEKAAAEKHTADSIAEVKKQDSIKAAEMAAAEKAKADSIAMAAAAQAKADSLAKAEEEAKAKGGKKAAAPKKSSEVKAGQGRG